MKFCTTCRKIKNESEFITEKYIQSDGRNNTRVRCIECVNKVKKVRRIK